MPKLSLRTKLIIVAAVPFALFLGLAVLSIHDDYNKYAKAKQTVERSDFFLISSALIHELQKERGQSGNFLLGGIPYSQVESQIAQSDEKAETFKKITDSGFQFSDLKSVRAQVSRKEISAADARTKYRNLITQLMSFETTLARASLGTSVESKMISVTLLESAKENAGRLRANISGILTANTPVNDEQFLLVCSSKSSVDTNLSSSGLNVSEEVAANIEQFLKGAEWKKVGSTFQLVLRNSDKGNFNQDPKEFFNTISAAIDQLAAFVKSEVEGVRAKAAADEKTYWNECVMMSLIAFFLAIGLVVVIAMLVKSVTKPISLVVQQLNESSGQISASSDNLKSASTEISAAVTESASALQETSTAVTQISAMVTKNSESAEQAQSLSDQGRTQALDGKNAMEEMMSSMTAIRESQDHIMNEVNASNARISNIVKVIAEIREKTKVINDIVFQTKLLSFNASVEAARAGEHGKGFAVVAEEIGSLASMSGQAAAEISQMLAKSTDEVESTIREATQNIESLMQDGKSKVSHGLEVSERFFALLDQIVSNVTEVNAMVNEIAGASHEQASGIREISVAVTQLDQTTQQNATASTQSAASADALANEVERLRGVIASLNETIFAQRPEEPRMVKSLKDLSFEEERPSSKQAA